MNRKSQRNLWVISMLLLFSSSKFVYGQDENEDFSDFTTQSPEVDTTTEDSTTQAPPDNRETFDYRFTTTSGLTIDVNFTQVAVGSEAMQMSMYVAVTDDFPDLDDLCKGNIYLYVHEDYSCPSITPGVPQRVEQLAVVNKADGTYHVNTTDKPLSYFRSHNCLIVGKAVEAGKEGSGSNDGSGDTEGSGDDADVTNAASGRQFRQLVPQADGAPVVSSNSVEDQPDEPGNLNDFYDPEDITDTGAEIDVADLEDQVEPLDDETRLGLTEKEAKEFLRGSCKKRSLAAKVPLFTPVPSRLTRLFLSYVFSSVLGTGSVAVSTSTSSGGAGNVVVTFGNPGSFTFNPLANWPQIVIQGAAVWATYGTIIVWALILGAIVWAIAIGNFGGFFSSERIGFVEKNMIYGPIEKLTQFVHSGIERFSELNRRNAYNNYYNKRRNYQGYQHRSSYQSAESYDYPSYDDSSSLQSSNNYDY